MIKVYAVGLRHRNTGEIKYLTTKSQFGFRYDGSFKTDLSSDISEAKHYSAKSRTKQVIRNLEKRIVEEEANLKENLKPYTKNSQNMIPAKHDYYYNQLIVKKTALDDFKKNQIEVFEYETEEENSNLHKIDLERPKFETRWDGTPYRSGGFTIQTETTNRHYCKLCGIKLRKIPQLVFNYNMGSRICAKCGIGIGEQSRQAWDGLESERREMLDKEYFLHKLE